MANWIYTIDLKPIWSKYNDLSHEDFDNDPDIFVEMKNEMISELKKQIKPGHFSEVSEVITSLKKSKHLSSFNSAWSRLYDFCDYKKIWLKTEF